MPDGWGTAADLLDSAQYERLAELLCEARATSERAGDAVFASLLDATYQICLACIRSHAEATWHLQAHHETAQRERGLKQHLRVLFDALRNLFASDGAAKPLTPPASEVVEWEKRPGLWRRLHSLLSLEPPVEATPREAFAALVEASELQVEPQVAGVEPEPPAQEMIEVDGPLLVVYCLGRFRVYLDDQPVEDWQSRKGKSIFKYLVTHRERPTPKEVLMELFWPDAHPDAARNNLNVAIYGLRQTFRQGDASFSHVLFQEDSYLLNPDLHVWTDFDAFAEHFGMAQEMEQCGNLASAIRAYQTAEPFYQGEFLEEDRYEEWPAVLRESLRDAYLRLLDCLSRHYLERSDYLICSSACSKMLGVDNCHEEAHRRLMRCFSRQGQRYLALRQYHLCVETLRRELDVGPSQPTLDLYERIQRRQQV